MCQTEAETEHLWNMEPYGTSGGPVAGVPSTCSRTWRSTACWNSCISAAPGGVETVELLLHVATTCKNMGCFWSCWTVLNSSYGCGSLSFAVQSFQVVVLFLFKALTCWSSPGFWNSLSGCRTFCSNFFKIIWWLCSFEVFFVHCFDSWCYSLVLTFGLNTNTLQTRFNSQSMPGCFSHQRLELEQRGWNRFAQRFKGSS